MTWDRVALRDLGQWIGGATPFKGNPAFWTDGSIPWLSPKDMGPVVLAQTRDSLTPEAVAGSSVKVIPANSVAVVVRSGILERTLPVGLVPFKTTLNQDMKALVPRPGIDPRWVAWGLRAFERELLRTTRKAGTTVASIEMPRFTQFELPVPDLAVQRRLVDLLEGHLSRLDAAADYESAALRRAKSLREELIRRAITGADLAGGRQAAGLTEAGTQDGDLPTLPTGWRWQRLGEVADVVGGVTKDAKKQGLPGLIEVPYLRVANVQRGGLRLKEVTYIRVSSEKASALRLRSGDVLLNEGGDRDKLARGWVWQEQIPDCIHQNHVFRARLHADLDPYFLSWTANTIGGRWAERNGKQSVNLASISLSMIRRMPVVVPPPGVSSAIVKTLTAQLEEVDRLQEAAHTSASRATILRQAVLTAAFEGKLTGRHTDDEVVEELAIV